MYQCGKKVKEGGQVSCTKKDKNHGLLNTRSNIDFETFDPVLKPEAFDKQKKLIMKPF